MDNTTPEFGLRIGGDLYTGWKDISVVRDITRMSGEFTVSLARQDAVGVVPQIKPGRAVSVEIDNAPVLKGYIDGKSVSYDAFRDDITVTGRDRIGDLIDCAATISGPYEYNAMPLDKVVRAVVKPYGIKVTNALKTTPTIKRLAIQPGETAFDFIERACRAYGVLPVSDGIGGLILTTPAAERSDGKLIYGENILSADVTVDATERHSLYVIKGQAEAVDSDTDQAQMSSPRAHIADSEVTRYRPKVVVAENQGYAGTLAERALAERKADRARGTQANYRVLGWYANADTLWKPNTLVSVTDELVGIDSDMLITGVSFNRGLQGTTTSLTLALPSALDIDTKAEKDKASSGTTTLWADDND